MLVEQAVFGSARTNAGDGYHLVERSPGLAESDARELVEWGPSHDSLSEVGPHGLSYNCFGLQSGAYCVSKTVAAGAEYSGRGGAAVQTQCLVVPAEVFARFSYNPFAVLRAAEGTGELQASGSTGAGRERRQAEPLRLVGRPAVVDHMLLAQLAIAPGPQAMAALVQQVLTGRPLVVVSPGGEKLLAGLISCLPLPLRSEISLSTGLKLSPRRPFRVSAAPADSAALRREARALGADVLVLERIGEIKIARDSWPALVEFTLQESKFSQLAAEISRRGAPAPAAAVPAEVPTAGHQIECLLRDPAVTASPVAVDELATVSQSAPPADRRFGRSDEAHARFESGEAAGSGKCFAEHRVKACLSANPEALELVERLDDLVFDAIGGKPAAFTRLVEFWPDVLSRLDSDVLAEAREQYLRHALGVWTRSDCGGVQDPGQAIAALDVLCLLFPESDFG